jgi:hypothetical protein
VKGRKLRGQAPPVASGISRGTLRQYVTPGDVLASQSVLHRPSNLSNSAIEALAERIDYALLDYVVATQAHGSRAAPGKIIDWADRLAAHSGALLADLGSGSQYEFLEAKYILCEFLPRKKIDETAFETLKGVLFQCDRARYQVLLSDVESLGDTHLVMMFNEALDRMRPHLALMEWMGRRISEKSGPRLRHGGSTFDRARVMLMLSLVPIYEEVSGTKASASKASGTSRPAPTCRWFQKLFDIVRSKAVGDDSLSRLPDAPSTVLRWIADALAARQPPTAGSAKKS